METLERSHRKTANLNEVSKFCQAYYCLSLWHRSNFQARERGRMQKEYDELKFMAERFCANDECCVTTLHLLKHQAEILPSLTCIPAPGRPAALRERCWQEPTTLMAPKPEWHELLAFQARGWQSLLFSLNLDCIFKKQKLKMNSHYLLGSGTESCSVCWLWLFSSPGFAFLCSRWEMHGTGSLSSDPRPELPREQFSAPQPTRKPRLCEAEILFLHSDA